MQSTCDNEGRMAAEDDGDDIDLEELWPRETKTELVYEVSFFFASQHHSPPSQGVPDVAAW